jgi:hypothetical protein
MLAPVVLFVYNRPDHTLKTLAALTKNILALQTDIIIYADGPKHDKDIQNVSKVYEIIDNVRGFASIKIIKRDQNYGLAKSIILGVSEVIERYGKVIVLEDDLVTTPRFLEYMNAALEFYKEDPKAFSIGAYQFPSKTMSIPFGYPFDTYSSYRCCSWGWATWKDRWQGINWEMDYFEEFINSPEKKALFDRSGPDMTQMLKQQFEGKIDSWAIRFCYAHFIKDARCIYPVKSLVQNIGLDNTGVHCGVDPRRQHDKLDKKWLPKKFCDANFMNLKITRSFYQAFCPEEYSKTRNLAHSILRKIKSFCKLPGA